MIKGIDTSRWEDNPATTETIDWNIAKQNGAIFVIMKATEGTNWKDPVYLLHKNNSAGIMTRGSFHYYRTKVSKQDQAKFYYNFAGNLELPPVLDLEDHYRELPKGNELVGDVMAMLDLIDQQFNQECILYTSPNIIKNYLAINTSSPLAKRKLWIANYGVSSPYYYPWSKWTFWQYTETGVASNYGIPEANDVDEDYYNGDYNQFVEEFGLEGSYPPEEEIPTEYKCLTFLNTRSMNIRSGPGLQYNTIGVLPPNTKFEIRDVGGNNAWVKIDDNRWVCHTINGTSYLERQ